MLKTALKPRWIAALILALAVSGVFVLLSQWQFSRSTERTDAPPVVLESTKPLLSVLDPGVPMHADAADQLVTAQGHFDASRQVLVQNRLQSGANGYWVVTAFIVDGAPVLKGAGATAETIIPVARGWLSDTAEAKAPPSGPITLAGRLIPSEAPNPKANVPAGQVAALSTAQLINLWQVSSYPGFIISNSELAAGQDVGAHAVAGDLKAITVTAQPDVSPINWLNIFYAVEWVVFAGFAVFLWWRLVSDAYRRTMDPEDDDDYDDGGDDYGGDGGDHTGDDDGTRNEGGTSVQQSSEVHQ
ncbi:SURF1 family protein [Paeniglutamicibacter antarcticus]|uniref:SURF1-like protein n=1 Tax=Arthrobacter terrae TaxID=2935737 RepID=A0A931CWR3_9MICC|nr:SURF1 family protein [Arthrobacter terrae]MBG0741338.1 SURF1 family protein [Arthrobacter terrae]